MVTKVKTCAGFDGKEHQAYIYKNIDGKKYCKFCALKLQPPKAIKKMSEKGVFKMGIKKELLIEDKRFYTEIWINRFFTITENNTYKRKSLPQCENPKCNQFLGDEPNLIYFHHILEKRNYPNLRHVSANIAVLCPECHNMYETFPDKVPYLVRKREELLLKFKNQ
jgi:hypothetical protein